MTAPMYLTAEWPAPANVRTLISTRAGGHSRGAFHSNNLAFHVGDDPEKVGANRLGLVAKGESLVGVQWLEQVHGVKLVTAGSAGVLKGDGCLSAQPGQACAVLTADCLPVLLCNRQGNEVAAVHAGWRGLAAGILKQTIERFAAKPEDILAYLGPAISQEHFEVGAEVLEVFTESPMARALGEAYFASALGAFVPSINLDRYQADLYSLARSQCVAVGVTAVYGGTHCTFRDRQKFYSYRRDGQTGRMASLIWLAM